MAPHSNALWDIYSRLPRRVTEAYGNPATEDVQLSTRRRFGNCYFLRAAWEIEITKGRKRCVAL
jgi:hypothetical protein